MADQPQDSLLREIDEELRRERYATLWKKYGHVVLGAAVVLVVAVAGYQGWRAWDVQTRSETGERFAAALALAQDGSNEAAAKSFDALAADAGSGYALLARFQQAAALAKGGKRDEAAARYRELAEDDDIDAVYRNLAVILGVMVEMGKPNAGGLRDRLTPLMADSNPWRFSAREISGYLAWRQGDAKSAREQFSKLAADTSAPQGVRARANDMLAVVGG